MNDQPDKDMNNNDQAKPAKNDLEMEALRHTATRGLENTDYEESEPRWGTARFNERTTLMLFVRGAPDPLLFDAGSVTELVIGRHNPDTGETPHVDLEPYSGTEKGVSRRHATIIRRDGSLAIVDAGSHNGTFLNGQRLVANQPRILRDGDDIRLGFLVLRVKFVKTQLSPNDPNSAPSNKYG
ncbi:MAG: FHA domain-containing protein [Anaerolineae bacterium]